MGKFSLELATPGYQKLISDTLGDKAVCQKFIAEVSTVVGNNKALQNCSTGSIVSAALLAQTLNLSIAPTLGYAYVIPYGGSAQFQLGWKGLVQLAQRSGQFTRLGVREVHKGEYVGQDEFGDDMFKFSHDCDDNAVVGYFAYMELTNGFKKSIYWTREQVDKHAKTYSQAYANGYKSVWSSDFDAMARKTVLKQLLSKWAPMSVEMNTAVQADQSVVNYKDGNAEFSYVDNEEDTTARPKSKTNVGVNVIPEEKTEVTTQSNSPTQPSIMEAYLSDEDKKPF